MLSEAGEFAVRNITLKNGNGLVPEFDEAFSHTSKYSNLRYGRLFVNALEVDSDDYKVISDSIVRTIAASQNITSGHINEAKIGQLLECGGAVSSRQ